jgi:enoyl-CoA hydratase
MSVLISQSGAVVTITINRPEARNAVDPATAAALSAAFREAEAEASVRAMVLTGAEGAFCAGADLKAVAAGARFQVLAAHEGPLGPSRLKADRAAPAPGASLSKPLIAAVEGHAVAGGLELALLADMRVASDTAVFGVFCRRWGVPLIDGGTVRLPRIIGQGRAMDMILTGRAVDADEAYAWGLANRRCKAGEALAVAQALAAEIARFPNLCMRLDRASAYAGWSRDLHDALLAEGQAGLAALQQEAGAGAQRFADGLGRGGDFSEV